jgi:crotonobetainyl-CoA:carnitine CoA-transferase CaiB-like acyl-CoA transferase
MTSGETVQVVRSPWRLTDTPMLIERGPPLLGEHTDEVLRSMRDAAAVPVS